MDMNEKNLSNLIKILTALFGLNKSKNIFSEYLTFREYPLKKVPENF